MLPQVVTVPQLVTVVAVPVLCLRVVHLTRDCPTRVIIMYLSLLSRCPAQRLHLQVARIHLISTSTLRLHIIHLNRGTILQYLNFNRVKIVSQYLTNNRVKIASPYLTNRKITTISQHLNTTSRVQIISPYLTNSKITTRITLFVNQVTVLLYLTSVTTQVCLI
uniref:Uncharacterized protein n=1 Tax=Cacopsylla melanoneura TaxID=428564 RepID=A0A8D8V632_9HEMI